MTIGPGNPLPPADVCTRETPAPKRWEGSVTSTTAPRGRRAARVLAGLATACLVASACGRAPAAGSTAAPTSSPTPASSSGSASAPSAAGPVAWASLQTATQLWRQRNSVGLAAPGHPGLLAVCRSGTIAVSRDGGTSWTSVPTAGVAAALAKTSYSLMGSTSPPPACDQALADPAQAGSVYAVFGAGQTKYGAPPIYYVAVYTTDGGSTWQAVPAPPGLQAGGFGGLGVTAAGAVQVMFGPTATGQPALALTQTSDGGRTWQTAALSCPSTGPCVRWGPAPTGTGSCAMHDYAQPIERSADQGRTWSDAYNPATLDLANGCDLGELVALGPTEVALVTRSVRDGAPSVRISRDGGQTWTAVTLPALPAGQSPAPQGVQLLPDGGLLSVVGGTGGGMSLDLLPQGASAWCTVAGVTLQGTYTNAGSVEPVGTRLLWVQAQQAGGGTVQSVPLASIHC